MRDSKKGTKASTATKIRFKKRTKQKKQMAASSTGKRLKMSASFVEQANTLKLSGALKWLLPTLESAYTPLVPKGAQQPTANRMAMSSLKSQGQAVLASVAPDIWKQALLDYKQRKADANVVQAGAAAPLVPAARNWQPLGPSVVLNGQTVDSQPVAGRVARLAIAVNASVVYAATASGGVFGSRDGGTTWRSLMDGFDLQPTNYASASLVCGAIALDLADPNRVYVGSGEGDTDQLFSVRIAHALPAYRGVGPIRSDDGGESWLPEPSAPDLAGEAFFGLAVDPSNRENVIAATTNGLYRRVATGGGQFQWTQVKPGVFASVVVASAGGVVRFFAAEWGQKQSSSGIFHSDDHGAKWVPTGTGLPTNDTGRIALGVQAGNVNLVYALVATESKGVLHGLYRMEAGGAWKSVTGLPDVLPVDEQGFSQGGYDLAIAIDPIDTMLVYLGGSYANAEPWPGSIWRCAIKQTGSVYTTESATSIGTHAHSDIHTLVHTPGDANELWCGCDGGVFLNRDAKGSGEFVAQNNGLSCLCSNFIGQHPTDPSIILTGLQDNGTARTAAGPVWTHVLGGDGGYCLINWANPNQVIAYTNGMLFRSNTGGTTDEGWEQVSKFPWSTMTQPLVSAPYALSSPADADLIALGVGKNVKISRNFATSWSVGFSIPSSDPNSAVFALAFASPQRLFAATTIGEVYRADRTGNKWTVKRLDNMAAGPLGVTGLINDIAIDWSDRTLSSVFVAFAGLSRTGDPVNDNRRVWRFDGSRWQDRSGSTAPNHLLNVEHNALVVDQLAPNNVYVGADIGVWHSADSGLNWSPIENGLPEAPVFDLQIHPTQRLLRAALYGRGVYEMPLD